MAGFLPGFGRGGITHSLLVMEVLGGGTATLEPALIGLIANCGVEDDGVDAFDDGEKSEPGEEAVAGDEMASLVGCGLVANLEAEFRTVEDAMLKCGMGIMIARIPWDHVSFTPREWIH